MTVENLITTILSVDYMFGATTALACHKGIHALVHAVLNRATNRVSGGDTSE